MIMKFPAATYAPDGEGAGSSGGPSSTAAPASTGGGSTPSPSSPSSPSSTSSGAASSSSAGTTNPPASTPSPAAPPASTGDGTDGLFDFPQSDPGDEDFDLSPDATTAPPVAPPVVPADPTTAQPPAAPASTAEPPSRVAAPAPGQQEASPLPSPAEPQKIAEMLSTNSAAIIDHLAQTDFKLSPEDIEALEADVTTAVPKLLSRMYVKSQINMLEQVQKIIPAMMARERQVSQRNEQNESKFYTRWPELNKAVHGDLVARNASLYRRMNPDASLDQMIEDLGPIIMVAAKVSPGAPPNGNHGRQPVVGPPGARLVSPPSPFQPAHGGPAAPPQQADANPWSGMAPSTEEE